MGLFRPNVIKYSISFTTRRLYSSMCEKRGLVLGLYSSKDEDIKLTPTAQKFNEKTAGKLVEQINICGPIKNGQTRLFWNLGDYPVVAVTGLGDACKWHELDQLNGAKENVRIASAAAVKALMSCKINNIEVEDFSDAQSAAEGAFLSAHIFEEYKSQKTQETKPTIKLVADSSACEEWKRGEVFAQSQNFARVLMETPANFMTPTVFVDVVSERLQSLNVWCEIHEEDWAEEKEMGLFLSVTCGSDEPAKFLELTYNGGGNDDKPICLVGKGITFDSGGISLKPPSKMDEMRADMGGAANVVSAISAIAELKVPINVKGFVPLCENMPGGRATKPGDVFYAMNGKSVCVDNTDAEGRLILADALCYAATFNPKFILDIATLTGAVRVALGDCVTGAFSTSNELYNTLQGASYNTGDRVWRLPLFKHYSNQMTEHTAYDLNNLGKGKGGGSCTAAAFLREFVPPEIPWIHLDIAGVMNDCSDQPYMGSKGMTGRPMRTLVEFLMQQAKD